MLKLRDLQRMFVTAKCVVRDGGIGGLFATTVERVRLGRQLSRSKNIKSVEIDTCTFDLGHLPNLPIKLALLNKTYEDFERRAVLQYVRPELPVVELGACIGVVACITNKLLNNPADHIVVEANPNVLPHLIENRATNRCEFEILNAAIAYDRESITFVPSMDFWGSSLEQKNGGDPVTVKTLRLRDIISARSFKSFTLICDIEGYEYDLIRHESEVLASADTIILETHARYIGEPKTLELLTTLRRLGFETVNQDAVTYVLRRSSDAA